MTQRRICGLLIVLLLILMGCGKVEKEGNRLTSLTASQTLHIGGLGGRPAALNPILTNQTVSMVLAELVFNRLIRINSRMMPETDLAESWQVSSDGLSYTFNLRQGVRFHDGVEFTAQDCEFTYRAVLDPANDSPWRDIYSMIKDIKAADRHTFVVTLNQPQASFINLMNFSILPKHLLDGRDIRTADFNKHPIGTGPFRFREWVNPQSAPSPVPSPSRSRDGVPIISGRGEGRERVSTNESIILEANPDYYEGQPQITQIIATGYDTFAQYFSAFMQGEIDMAFFLNQEQLETVRRDPEFRACQFPSIYTYAIDYNPAHPLVNSKPVRRAMALAINIPEIINKVENGLGIQSTGPFLPNAWFSNPEVSPLEYNPAQALRLLKEEGWELNSNGILERGGQELRRDREANPKGSRSEFRFIMLVDPKERITEMLAKMIYQDLYKIGIRMEIKLCDYNRLEESSNKELIDQAGAAVISIRIILTSLDPSWHSDNQQRMGTLWRHPNPEIDQLFEQVNTTYDLDQRQGIYHRLHRMVYDAQPASFLYFLPNLAAVNKRFDNTEELFSPAMPFYTIKDWGISSSGHPERSEGSH